MNGQSWKTMKAFIKLIDIVVLFLKLFGQIFKTSINVSWVWPITKLKT
jgi:hypothetical protein